MDRNEDAVVLRRHPKRWKHLPPGVKARVEGSIAEVERLWISIADGSPAGVMPPVGVFDTAWVTPDKQGLVTVLDGILTVNGSQMIGVCLPAPSAIYADEETLRGILLRGFLMALGTTRDYLLHAVKGEELDSLPRDGADLFDPSFTVNRVEQASHWFSREDCELLERDLSDSMGERTISEWISAGLPAAVPDMEMIAEGGLVMPTQIRDHLSSIHGIEGA